MLQLRKRANIITVRKDGEKELVSNYCSISFLPIPAKYLERFIHTAVHNHIVPFLSDWQHGFRGDPALPDSSHQWAKAWDEGHQMDVVFLFLAKEFEQIPRNILLENTGSCNFGISGSSLSWCADYPSNCQQQVVIDGVHSWLYPGLLIFFIFISALSREYNCPVC